MVIYVLPKINTPPVIWVEVHIERIHLAVATIVDNQSKAFDSGRVPGTVGFDSIEPGWMRGNIIVGRQVNAFPAFLVQSIEIVKGQRCWEAVHDGKIDFGFGMYELGSNVTGKVGFVGIQPDDRS